jgi:hypothetical protein
MDGDDFYPGGPLRGNAPWLLVVSSFWLRLGVIAAGCALFGLTELYRAHANILTTLVWIFGCAWVAAHSLRRARTLLDRLDDADIGPETRTSDASAASVASHGGPDRHSDGAPTVAPQAPASR